MVPNLENNHAGGGHPIIRTLQELKDWNANPGLPPFVLQWFMDYFFALLDSRDFETAKDAYDTMQIFREKSEKIAPEEATLRNQLNYYYYSGFSSIYSEALGAFYDYFNIRKVYLHN